MSSVESEVLGPPDNVVVTPTRPDRVTVSWDPVPGAIKYYVDVASSTAGPFTFLATARAPDTFARIANLTVGTDYCFQVRTEDGTGPGGSSPPVCSQTANLPPPPGNVVVTQDAPEFADVTWSPVAGAVKYYIYQSTSSSGPFTFIGTASGTMFRSRDLLTGQMYCYRVVVETSVGRSGQSPSSCTGGIAPPTDVMATAISTSRIRIDWTPVPAGATKYYVYESKDGAALRFRATVLATNPPTYTAGSLTAGSEYCYRLRTQGAAGTPISGYSAPACATP